jgi:hypothetical protein
MNKLDTFNKDKFKCKKCKDYYDIAHDLTKTYSRTYKYLSMCETCYKRWNEVFWNTDMSKQPAADILKIFEDWCNNDYHEQRTKID